MITEDMIDVEAARIAESIGKEYQCGNINVIILGEKLKILSEFTRLTKRSLKNMQTMECES